MLRIINIFNKNINLNDLKHLKEIYEIIDLKNIDRLTTTFDSLEVAIKIFNLLKVNLPDPEEEKLKDNQLKNLRINIITQKQKHFLRGNSSKEPISLSNWKKVNELSKAKISYTKLNSNMKPNISMIIPPIKCNNFTFLFFQSFILLIVV